MRDSPEYKQLFLIVSKAPRSPGIYAIKCNDTGKFYIGGTINLRNRLKGHLYAITRQSKSHPMTNDVIRYGLRSVSVTILEMCNTGHDVIEAEKTWQHKFNSVECGYNETYGNVNDYAWSTSE